MEDQLPSANNTRDTECKIPITEDEGEDHHQYFDGCRIHRVPPVMRFKKPNEEDHYAPKIVSFGPYYHGVKELGMAEELKHEVFEMFVSSSGKDREIFYRPIFKVIDKIRNCYVGVSRDAYDDDALAEMMLLDASFAIYLMEINLRDMKKFFHFRQHLGMAVMPFAIGDMNVLENQIPLWVINLLTKLIYGEEYNLIYRFFSFFAFANSREIERIPGEDERQVLHLLDAYHRLHVEELDSVGKEQVEEVDNSGKKPYNKCQRWPWRKENPNEFGKYNRQSRSVTDLKAKGIHFKPSSYCLKNIKFKSYTIYGQLQLPVLFFHANSKQTFLQMIAHEITQVSNIDFTVICYVNFMKSLIVKPEDVKELREKKILFSDLDSDEQIVEVIKEIDTRGHEIDNIFGDVKMRIEEHCSNKAKTWIAELIHTYFRNPWTFIALLYASFLLCLTFLQTYYTMNPLK